MSAAADLEIASRAMRGTNYLRNAALVVLGQNGSGRVYRNGHVASAPGQPPSPDKGHLKKNWQQQHTVNPNGQGKHGLRITLKIKSDQHYARFMEYGTRYIARRPFHDRIKQKARPAIVALFSSI